MNKNLLKTFLVAAGLTAGTVGAWADTYEILYGVPVYGDAGDKTIVDVNAQDDFTGDPNEKTDVEFTDANGSVNTEAMPIDGSVLYAGGSDWTKDFSEPVTTGKVFFAGNYTVSANNSNTFRIVDSNGYAIYMSTVQTTGGNGNQDVAIICGEKINSYVRQARKVAYGVKSICIDMDSRTVTYDLIVSGAANKVTELTGTVPLADEVKDVKGLLVKKTSYGANLDNVMLYSQISEDKKYQYTINYKLGDDVVYASSASVVAGTVVTAQSIVYDENESKYFVINEVPTFEVTDGGSNVFDVPVRKAYTATLNVTTTIGGSPEKTTTSLVEDDDRTCNWSYAYPLYAEKDGVWYVADNAETFGEKGTFEDGKPIDRNIIYSTSENDVVIFHESGSTAGTDFAYSNGETSFIEAGNYASRGKTIGTLPAGKYQYIARITGNAERCLMLRKATEENVSDDSNVLAGFSEDGIQTAEFILAEETTLLINGRTTDVGKTNQSADFDYVIIKRIGDAVETVSVSSAGLATYTPSVALDFTGAKNIAAYKASVEGTAVILTKVSTVAAGEGVLVRSLAGGATSEDIPAVSGVEASADNAFVGTLETIDALASEDGEYSNYILNNGTQGLGFYAANNQKVAAGKAYLRVSTASGAKPAFIGFGGDTTGIGGIESGAESGDGVLYNISGQRVTAPGKGLYILNGKKVIMK